MIGCDKWLSPVRVIGLVGMAPSTIFGGTGVPVSGTVGVVECVPASIG